MIDKIPEARTLLASETLSRMNHHGHLILGWLQSDHAYSHCH